MHGMIVAARSATFGRDACRPPPHALHRSQVQAGSCRALRGFRRRRRPRLEVKVLRLIIPIHPTSEGGMSCSLDSKEGLLRKISILATLMPGSLHRRGLSRAEKLLSSPIISLAKHSICKFCPMGVRQTLPGGPSVLDPLEGCANIPAGCRRGKVDGRPACIKI